MRVMRDEYAELKRLMRAHEGYDQLGTTFFYWRGVTWFYPARGAVKEPRLGDPLPVEVLRKGVTSRVWTQEMLDEVWRLGR